MTIQTNIVADNTGVTLGELFRDAVVEVNEWRGRCLHAFTSAEAAVTETLLCMAQSPQGKNVRLPHLVGQRFEALEHALSGDFKKKGESALAALKAFKAEGDLRTALCHGISEITLASDRTWVLILRVVCFRNKRAVRDIRVLKRDEAQRLRERLGKSSQALCSKLNRLNSQLN